MTVNDTKEECEEEPVEKCKPVPDEVCNDVVTKKIEKVPQSICKIVLSLLMISFWCKCTNSKQVLIFFRHSKVFQYLSHCPVS